MAAATGHIQRRLIIHCGVQKTASTALHHFLQNNRDALSARLEILTPERKSLTRALGRSAAEFSLDPGAEAGFVNNLKAMRDHLMQSDMPCLLSHENLPGAMPGRQGVTALFPMLPGIVELLETHLAPLVPEYVFYTREMSAWKRSVHNQAVKSDACAWTRDEFLAKTKDCADWDDMDRRAKAIAGPDRVTMFRLEDEQDPQRPGAQLLHYAGLNARDIAALKPLSRRPNQSLNDGSLEFMRQLNASELPAGTRGAVAKLVTQNQALFAANWGQV